MRKKGKKSHLVLVHGHAGVGVDNGEANHAKAEAEKVHVDIAAIRQELEDWKCECILLGKKLKHNAKKASADLQKAKDGEDAAVKAAKKAEADAEQARSEVELLKEMIQTLRLEARGRVLKKKQGLAGTD